jgi:hypothetical protein
MSLRVRSVLESRDRLLSASQRSELPKAYKLNQGVRRRGVYLWFHMHDSTKMYVGSYHATSLFERTHQHLGAANSQALAVPRPHHPPGSAPRQLYSHMLGAGCKDVMVIPLQLLPPTATARDVLICEQRWMDRYCTLVPHGYNARRARVGVEIDNRHQCVTRYYNCRNMCRRVYVVYRAHVLGHVAAANVSAFLQHYRTKTIVRMHTFITLGAIQLGTASVTDAMGEWRVPIAFVEMLRVWLADVLAVRLQRPPPLPKQRRRLMVCSYWSTIFDHLDFHAAFAHPTVVAALPDTWGAVPPVVGFKYAKPLGLTFCNHVHTATSLTVEEVQHYMSPATQCPCQQPRYAPFVHGALGHVVTCNEQVLLDCPSPLHALFRAGFKHRPQCLRVCMSPVVRAQVLDDIRVALVRYSQQYSHQLPAHFGRDLSLWTERVLAVLEEQLYGVAFADGKFFSNASKPHEPGTEFVPYLDRYGAYISQLHRDFVVTRADKLGNNYVVVCKRFYVQSIMADLDSGQFYARVPHMAGGATLAVVPDMLLPVVMHTAPDMYPKCTSGDHYRAVLRAVPYEAALVKLHKQPYALRFLACSGTNGLKPPAVWLTALLRALHVDLAGAWRALLEQVGVDWATEPPWYAGRSVQVVDNVRRFNNTCMSRADFLAGRGWHGYDVVRLYTNIDLQDLCSKLSDVFTMAWGRHDGCAVVQVFADPLMAPVWHHTLPTAQQRYGGASSWQRGVHMGMYNGLLGVDAAKGRFYLFDLQHAIAVLRLLVENSYVRFGPYVYHQTRGIPMGINPAVFMANYYLFHYEYQFVYRLVQIIKAVPPVPGGSLHAPHLLDQTDLPTVNSVELKPLHGSAALYLLHCFRFTVRFVDDLTSGPNAYLQRLLYTENALMGDMITGIYPHQYLSLDSTPAPQLHNPYDFSTLDVRIVSTLRSLMVARGLSGSVVHSVTHLYDKRRERCYRAIPIVQYTHVSSTLSMQSGYNILLGQLFRFRELITVKGNYVMEAAKLVARMTLRGYRRTILMRKLRRHLLLYPDTYGDVSFRSLFGQITVCLRYLDALDDGFDAVSDVWDVASACPDDCLPELEEVTSDGADTSDTELVEVDGALD